MKLDVDREFGDLRTHSVWDALVKHLTTLEWVSYIQPPPRGSKGPSELVRYLSRYLTCGPISDSRIVSANARGVTFLAREGKVQGGESRQVPVTLFTTEFVRRWCLHIEPDQLTKTRYFGGWSNAKLSDYTSTSVRQMELAEVPHSNEAMEFPPEPQADGRNDERPLRTCPQCEQATLEKVASWERPGWDEIFRKGGTEIPEWYR
ncbi:MAG: transposase [Planctomycetales bacterium]|nr:transposase [Planctomycetales bacterium]